MIISLVINPLVKAKSDHTGKGKHFKDREKNMLNKNNVILKNTLVKKEIKLRGIVKIQMKKVAPEDKELVSSSPITQFLVMENFTQYRMTK
jgi:hypothetical protein